MLSINLHNIINTIPNMMYCEILSYSVFHFLRYSAISIVTYPGTLSVLFFTLYLVLFKDYIKLYILLTEKIEKEVNSFVSVPKNGISGS